MKKIILSVSMLLLSISIFAQEPIVNWGEMQENDVNGNQISQILSYTEDGLFVLREGGPITDPQTFIEKYDNNFNLVFSNTIQAHTGVMGDQQLYERTMFNGTDFYAFYTCWNKAEGKSSLKVLQYDINGEKTEVEKILTVIDAQKQLNSGYNYTVFSPDYSKLLIFTNLPFVKKTNEKIRMTVYDVATLEQLWTKDVTLDVLAKRGVNNEAMVDNNGSVYMFKKINLPKGVLKYQLYTCNAKTQDWITTSFSHENYFLNDYKLMFNTNGDFTVNGFFASKNNGKYEGSIYCRIDPTTLDVASQKSEFLSTSLLEHWLSESAAAKVGASLNNYKIQTCQSLSNGNSIIVCEYQSESKTNIAAAGAAPNYQYDNRREDVIVMCINTTGEQLWSVVMDKKQKDRTANPDYSFTSFTYSLVNDQLYILWNNSDLNIASVPPVKWLDDKGVEHKQKHDFNSTSTGSPTFLRVIDKDGNFKYDNSTYGMPLYSIYDRSPFPLNINTHLFVPTKDGILIMGEMYNKKRYKFGFIKF